MMVCIEKFLGQKVEIPEDRRYHLKQGLWAKGEGNEVRFGLAQPALVLGGGVDTLDWLVEDGERVGQGESVIFAITGKILYLETPVAGTISFNKMLKQRPAVVRLDPYDTGWLFSIAPEIPIDEALKEFGSAENYLDILKHSEGFKNPEGIKGGVSGICKAVYSGIREQKIG
jgi:glycine cleavage system H lipoate-binding protein